METNNKNFAKEMLDFILEQDGFKVFRDEKRKPWAELEDNETIKIFPCDSSAFEGWCRKIIYAEYGVNPHREGLKNIIELLKAKAVWGKREHKLHNRIAWHDGFLVYDLSNDAWEKVIISDKDWVVVKKDPTQIFFKRYGHQNQQVTPEKGASPEYAKRLLEYVNITDEDQKILFIVWIISCFLPDFPHPLLYVYGPQGSAKSTISRIVREIIDPSLLEVGTLPKNHEALVQQLDHNWINFFDNVSYIDQDMSDLLCKAITGIGISKRELYTNDEDVIYNFMRCIGVNGINLEGAQPDLLERSILLNLKRMDDTKRVPEDKLWKDFRENKQKILGSIFSALSHAISIKDSIKVDELPRMADFALWGCAIAEALGYKQEDFYNAYKRNIEGQVEESINSSGIAVSIYEFMMNKAEWKGTPRDLFRELSNFLNHKDELNNRDFPKNEVILGKKIGQLEVVLGKVGLIIERHHGEQRIIKILNRKFMTPSPYSHNSNDSTDGKDPYDNPSLISF
jgi:hypothetical protein